MPAERLRVTVTGWVQGVGFRPFAHRLAVEIGLAGRVRNNPAGVVVEVEGPRRRLAAFLRRLRTEPPPPARVHGLEAVWLEAAGLEGFVIEPSESGGGKSAPVLPDLAVCPDCLREMRDPADRRHRYPFVNCTRCGPRHSIVEALPYDRSNTSMRRFPMCPDCEREYRDPTDRRFHAEPIACPRCGPRLTCLDADGTPLAEGERALRAAARALRRGRIVALKGLGGYQLLVDARDEAAVRRLRDRKLREEKPFALMAPSLAAARRLCRVSAAEARLLRSPEAPIVLLDRRRPGAPATAGAVAPAAAPGNPCLGIMLPNTPLHHLLLAALRFPVVATSGNRSDEPICIDEAEALDRLRGIADLYLTHDRPIVRAVDDSLARVLLGRELVLRRARGYAPAPIAVPDPLPTTLALGAHLKNTVALGLGHNVFLSQHIGDLETPGARAAFERAAADLPALYDLRPARIACDRHPDYHPTRFARTFAAPRFEIPHHAAHVAACMAENELRPPLLGVAWDGAGYGDDGTIWGGEFFRVETDGFHRVAHLRPFRLPGGDAAAREPRRCALGLLHALYGGRAFRPEHPPALRRMLARGVNAPWTSSAGRLFDAVAAILGLRERSGYEGQAAMDLEFAADPAVTDAYPVEAGDTVDWGPAVDALLSDDAPVPVRAARFHNTLAEAIVAVAHRVGHAQVALSGGCFQNRRLTERTVARLREEGFRPHWHQRVPPNDGGIALGQVVLAAAAPQT